MKKREKEPEQWLYADGMVAVTVFSSAIAFCYIINETASGSKDSAYSKYMSDAIFKIPTPQLLSKIIDALDNVYTDMAKNIETDTKGDIYEYLLAKLSTAGVNGQFRTPRHIIRMMVELLAPNADDTICDPACGTSGFLVSAGEYIKEKPL